MMGKVRSKLLIIILLILLICNFVLPNYVFADEYDDIDEAAIVEEEQNMNLTQRTIPLFGGVVELFMDTLKLGIIIPGMIVCGINTGLRKNGWKQWRYVRFTI